MEINPGTPDDQPDWLSGGQSPSEYDDMSARTDAYVAPDVVPVNEAEEIAGSWSGDTSMSYEDAFGEFASIFRHGIPNPKLEERRTLLAEHPELRLRINLEPLRCIIDFAAFKCVHGSSVARDEAIRGSDIDCGLVVLHEPTVVESEIAFVNELRAQGFDAYHPTEVATAKAAYEDGVARGVVSTDWQEYQRLSREYMGRDLSRIDFITEDVLQAADPFIRPGKTYAYGYSIT
jgi:hypothetical protein